LIREAQVNDCNYLEMLYKVLVPKSKNIKVLPERINQILNDQNNFLFLYDDNGIIEGTIFVTLCLDPMYEFRPYAVVENVIVRPESRNKGIGKNLLEHVEKLCIDRECTKIMLISSNSRTEAHTFFMKNGYNGNISKGFKKYIPIS
jgi:GNAT superfamily N-acetyltransferase